MIPGIIAQQAPVGGGGGGTLADAVYSLRKAVLEYEGPVVQGKRASDSALKDFYPAGDGWIDLKEVATWAGSSDVTVETWYDQSGNGNHAVDGFASAPHLAIGGVTYTSGGNPAILFGGSNQTTKKRLRAPFNIFKSAYTIVFCGERNNSGSTGAEWGTMFSAERTGTLYAVGLGYRNSRQPDLQQIGVSDSAGGTAFNNNTPIILGWKAGNAFAPSATYTVTPYVDKAASSDRSLAMNSATLSDDYTHIGGTANGSGHWAGRISEIVISLTALSDPDRESIEDDMNAAMGYAAYASSWATVVSTGDRTSLITATSSGITFTQGNATKLIDGSNANNCYWATAAGTGAAYLEFDFGGTARTIAGLRLTGGGTSSNGNWRLEGSNDGSTWTAIDPRFLPATDFLLKVGTDVIFDNNTAYRYYRVRHMSGNRVNSDWLYELLFRAI